MRSDAKPIELRPLSIGEIFDRAVTLLVRHWAPLLTIAAVQVLPSLITYDFATATRNDALGTISSVAGFMLGIVTTIATAAYIAALYRGDRITVSRALATAVQRLPAGIGAQVLVAFGAGIPFALLGFVAFTGGAFRNAAAPAVILSVIALLAIAAWAFCMVLCGMFALAGIGVKGLHVMESVGNAFRLLRFGSFGRTLLFGVALMVLVIGSSVAAQSVKEALAAVGLGNLVGDGLQVIVAVVTSPLADVVIAVFYFDVAIRREGYDLQLALDSLS